MVSRVSFRFATGSFLRRISIAFFLTELSASRYSSTSLRSVVVTFMEEPEVDPEVVFREEEVFLDELVVDFLEDELVEDLPDELPDELL